MGDAVWYEAHEKTGRQADFGSWLNPVNDFGGLTTLTVTARTSITPFDLFNPYAEGVGGTVHLSDYGAGVQDSAGNGSTRISGQTQDAIEEIILTFERPVSTAGLFLQIKSYKPGSGYDDKDDPVIFALLDDGSVMMFDEFFGIEYQGSNRGTVDFEALLDPSTRVASIVIRETRSRIGLETLQYMDIVPTPGTMALLGIAGFMWMGRRRRT